MHLALAVPELSGHMNPSLTLARELLRRGHRVTVVARPDGEDRARRAGLDFATVGAREFPAGSIARQTERLGTLTAREGLRTTVEMMRLAAETTLRDMPAVVAREGIDGVLVDQVNPAAGTVAEIAGLPYVKLCNALALDTDPDCPPAVLPWRYRPDVVGRLRNRLGNWFLGRISAPIRDTINACRARHGLALRIDDRDPAYLATIAQQPPFFDFPRSRPSDRLHFTGPWHSSGRDTMPFPWERLDGRPLVYASLGTLQNRIEGMFVAIAEALAALEVQLVISLGGADRDAAALAARLPGQPVVVPAAPQLALLDRAALAITHAGLNTALEAVARGVPMVAIPITNDQPGVARRLEWLGLAEVVMPRRLTAVRLRGAVGRVLRDPGYRHRAASRAAEIARTDGVGRAADIVEEAFRTGRPVTVG